MGEKHQRHFIKLLMSVMKILPYVLVLVLIIGAFFLYPKISLDMLIEYTTDNILTGIAVVLALYAIKSLTVVFPVPVLYIAVGTVFPAPAAVAVNLAGLCLALSLPYGLGRLAGTELHRRILEKYPKARAMADFKEKHTFFMIYLIRLIGIFSVDLTSLMMGSSGLPFKTYLLASLLGMLPSMVIATFLGANVTDPLSPEFAVSAVLTMILLVISFILYRKYKSVLKKAVHNGVDHSLH